MNSQKAPVSERALLQRINRKLRREDEVLKVSRTARMVSSVGRYYVVDVLRNIVSCQHVDPESLGRDLGVLREWEELK